MKVFNIMLNPGRGGTEQASLDYARLLNSRGNNLAFAYRTGSWAEKQLLQNSYKVYFETVKKCPVPSFIQKINPYAWHQLRSHINLFSPDIVLTHGGDALDMIVRKVKPEIPVANVTHINKHYHKSAPFAYLSLCKEIQSHIAQKGNYQVDRLPIVYNTSFDAIQERVQPANADFIFGAFGRFHSQKGFDRLLKSFAKVYSTNKRVKLVLGGFGEEEQALKSLADQLSISHRVEWVKVNSTESDRRSFFSKIDAFVLTSRWEMFPLVALEAMTQGVPILTTPVGACADIFEHRQNALIMHNDSEIFENMLWAIEHPSALAQIGLKGQELFTNKFAPDKVAIRLKQACEQIIDLWSEVQ